MASQLRSKVTEEELDFQAPLLYFSPQASADSSVCDFFQWCFGQTEFSVVGRGATSLRPLSSSHLLQHWTYFFIDSPSRSHVVEPTFKTMFKEAAMSKGVKE